MSVKRLRYLITLAFLVGSSFALPAAAHATGVPFGVESFSNAIAGPGEAAPTQAGSHPESMTFALIVNHKAAKEGEGWHLISEPAGEILPEEVTTGGEVRDVEAQLPRGFIVDPNATPQRCSEAELAELQCPVSAAVGRIAIGLDGLTRAIAPLYNMVPPYGVPAMIGFNVGGLGIIVHIDGHVRADGDYGLTGYTDNILQTYPLYSIAVTLWGDPSDPSHNDERGQCAVELPYTHASCPDPEPTEAAFLTMPGSCPGQPLTTALSTNSWTESGVFDTGLAQSAPAISGCAALKFEPTIEAKPETEGHPVAASDSATGLHFDLHFPQDDEFGGTATAILRNAVVTLPAGLAIDPSAAEGLETCTPAQIGLQGPADERQAIVLPSSAHAFRISLKEGESTGELLPDASASEVQEALEALPAIGTGNVKEVLAKHGGWEVTYQDTLAGREGPRLSGEIFTDATQTVSVNATGGTFKLESEHHATASLPYNATAAIVQSALEKLSGLGKGNVAVTGGPPFSGIYVHAYTYAVAFDGTLAGDAVGPLTAVSALTGGSGVEVGPAQAPGGEPLPVTTMQTGGALLFKEKVPNPEKITPEYPEGFPEYTLCPDASKVGNVLVKTPLLHNPLPGSVYLAQPHENPFGSLLALYLVVEEPERGVVVKLAGHVEVGGEEGVSSSLPALAPGQIRATFDENPELPVEDVKFETANTEGKHEGLFGGSRAPLTTPPTCGSYAAESVLEPWSHQPAPDEAQGTPNATPSSLEPFQITTSPVGGACPQTLAQEPNAPAFTAGTFTPTAGSYSPFVLKLTREDGSQPLTGLSLTLPPGMLGKIAGIEQCPQADIEAAEHRGHEGQGVVEQEHPSCPSGSEIGTATVGAGSGAPYYVRDGIDPATGLPYPFSGRAYLAGPYEGAPFSVVVVTPAVAGPFDLGTVIVRTGLYINPETAQVTAVAKAGSIPTSVHGIPVDVRSLTVELTRSQFTLNSTSCNKLTATGTAFGESSPAAISAPFQVGGCNGLPFKPALTASAGGHGSKVGGTNLNVEVTSAGVGQANIAKLHLQFPKTLSARLTTLQKACTEKVFNVNPASCDPDSVIGHALVHTPLLASPLTGPAILVSHGGAAFPDVEFVLQGEGVEVVVDAKTDIKSGVTYSYIESAPDAPFTSFETEFPSGPDSIFATNVPTAEKDSLCAQTLEMPIEMTGQNGTKLAQNIKIAPTGCANALRVISKKLGPAGKTLTLSVEVPAAGKLTASGKGLKGTSKTSTARQIVSLSISLAKGDAAKIAKHKSVKVKVTLAFAPSSGKKLTSSFAATYKGKAKGKKGRK